MAELDQTAKKAVVQGRLVELKRKQCQLKLALGACILLLAAMLFYEKWEWLNEKAIRMSRERAQQCYTVYGVDADYSDGEIKSEWHRLAKVYHPDVCCASTRTFEYL